MCTRFIRFAIRRDPFDTKNDANITHHSSLITPLPVSLLETTAHFFQALRSKVPIDFYSLPNRSIYSSFQVEKAILSNERNGEGNRGKRDSDSIKSRVVYYG